MSIGTNVSAVKSSTVKVMLTNDDGDAIFAVCSSTPSGDTGYAAGCLIVNTTSSALLINQGTATVCTFTTTLSG